MITNKTKVAWKSFFMVLAAAIFIYNCKSPKQKPFIYYGEEVKKDEIPWQVALYLTKSTPAESSFCGGVIINKKWIVTAAHCFEYMYSDTLRIRNKEDVKIFSGSVSLLTGGITSEIDQIIIPGDYDPIKRLNDIALIELSSPIDLKVEGQSKINTPTLSEYQEYSIEGTNLIISGWGVTDKEEKPTELQKATVPIANHDKCIDNYFNENEIVTNDMICAGYDYGGADSCKGDSGGPIFSVDENGKPILIGIVSWGVGCSQNGLYGVYTNIFKYVPWIESYCSECIWGDINS